MILIVVLFLVPIYYIAKSKGRSGASYSVAAGVLALLALDAPMMWDEPRLGSLQLAFPAAVLLLVALLPVRPGAPGKAYLKIEFACPECGQTVTFPREREGAAELCPKCGELIRVATDEFSPVSGPTRRTKPEGVAGEVCFDTFGRPEPADQLAAILNDNGVNARVSSDGGGGVLPQVGNTQGHRVMIDVAQWEDAVKIEQECQQDESTLSAGAAEA